MRDLANVNLGVGLAVLSGQCGTREAVAATGSFREGRRSAVEGQKLGYDKALFDVDSPSEDDALLAEEAELTARLEALREKRAAR